MEEQLVRDRADALCAALVVGDIELATQDFSKELRQNLGEVLALLPLPLSEATIDSIERGGNSGYNVVLTLVGETEEVQIQTRWKDRDGEATVVEASHVSRKEAIVQDGDAEDADDGAVSTD
ncbi:MAG: hypothetical protein ABIP77_02165 [Candidatus Limnocylindrales bacterium]